MEAAGYKFQTICYADFQNSKLYGNEELFLRAIVGEGEGGEGGMGMGMGEMEMGEMGEMEEMGIDLGFMSGE